MTLAIYGAGGLGREVMELAKLINGDRWDEFCFVEDMVYPLTEREVDGMPVFDFGDFTAKTGTADCQFVIAVGEPAARDNLYKKVKDHGYSCATLIHPSVYVSGRVCLGEGVIVLAYSYISCNASIGDNSVIQNMVTVGHDTKIGRSSVISMYSGISGGCNIGSRTYLGLHTSVREKIAVGDDAILGMASVVQRDIPENVIAMGNPARPMKRKDDSTVF